MTGIDDAELDKLFWQCGPENDCDAFCAALNERLEAADRMAQRIVVADQLVEAIDSMHHSMRYGMNLRTAEALAAYRQSKERT